jgi:large subunit ribosomal protein L5
MARLYKEYIKKIKPNLMKELGLKNIFSVPELKKIVINIGLGIDASDKKKLEATIEDLKKISGQMPIITKTKKAIANFKTKKDMPIGCKVTLRRKRMYEFIDRLINIALPRTKDFSGLSEKNFDGLGNYTFGIKEHIIFPEIDYDKIDKVKGMDITIVTSTKKNNEAKSLLKAFNFPLNK